MQLWKEGGCDEFKLWVDEKNQTCLLYFLNGIALRLLKLNRAYRYSSILSALVMSILGLSNWKLIHVQPIVGYVKIPVPGGQINVQGGR